MKRFFPLILMTALLPAFVGCGAEASSRTLLANGLTLISDKGSSNIVAVKLFIKAPQRQGRERLCFALAARMLMQGTRTRDAGSFHTLLEENGIEMEMGVTDDYALLSLRALPEALPLAAGLIRQVLTEPAVNEEVLAGEINAYGRELASADDSPFSAGLRELYRLSYGHHPYAFDSSRAESDLKSIDRNDILKTLSDSFLPHKAVLSVCGNVDAAALADDIVRGWQAGCAPLKRRAALFYRLASASRGSFRLQKNIGGEWLFAACRTPSVRSDDYAALKVLNAILGGGMDSRLFAEIREKRGLSYEVASFYPSRMLDSRLVIYLGTSPDKSREALSSIMALTEDIRQRGVTEEELESAKAFLIGTYTMGLERNAARAFYGGWFELMGVGSEYMEKYPIAIASVTRSDVRAAAGRYLRDWTILDVGPGMKGGRAQ